MKNIVLTGFMASGKTEVGKAVAKLCGFSFVDTDQLIIEREGKSINRIFEDNGEEYFRNLESETVKYASKLSNTVIATGGGVVLRTENIEYLRESGIVFCLEPSFEIISERIKDAAKSRPLLKGQSLEQIKARYDARKPFYNNCDYKITINEKSTPIETAKQIVSIYNIKNTQ
ncbi:MAG: shikimate kinase [Clostridia bacterium]|nr:shikimate kinase [Clostridia bacterium]